MFVEPNINESAGSKLIEIRKRILRKKRNVNKYFWPKANKKFQRIRNCSKVVYMLVWPIHMSVTISLFH